MGDVTPAAVAKEAAAKKAEMDASMGRPSPFKSGGPTQAASTAPQSTAPAQPSVSSDNEQHFTSMVKGLRHLFGIKDTDQPAPNGGMSREAGALAAVNQGIKDGSTP